jgi:regulator of replication initiation timing
MSSIAPLPTVSSSTSAAPTSNNINNSNNNKENNSSETTPLCAENTKLKKEVETLKKENQALRKENEDLKRKRKTSTSDSGNEPASKKCKTPMQRRKLFEKWAKALVRESSKSKITNGFGANPYSATVKETTPWTKADFESIFAGHGTKIQPTPEHKPTSQITILRLDTFEQIQRLFADAEIKQEGYSVQAWRSRNFSKSYKAGMYQGFVKHLDVVFHKSKGTMQLEFGMETNDDGYDYC